MPPSVSSTPLLPHCLVGANPIIWSNDDFNELAGDVPVEIEFITDAAQADALLELLKTEKVRLFYIRMPVDSGVSGTA